MPSTIVARRVGVERDAVVEVDDLAVADRDVVEAVVADARAEALAVDRVAVEVDRDAVGADHQAVEQAVGEVVAHQRCCGVMTWPQETNVGTGAAPTVHCVGRGRRVDVARARRARGPAARASRTPRPVSSYGDGAGGEATRRSASTRSVTRRVVAGERERGGRCAPSSGPGRTRSGLGRVGVAGGGS